MVIGSVTIKDIAKKCGVSVSTVSRAINDYPGINQNTKDMIMQVVRENQFIPNNSARNLKRLENHSIIVVIKGLNNPFFIPMVEVLEKVIRQHKYSFILQRVNDGEDEIEVASEVVLEKKAKGIVFLGGYFYHRKEKLKQLNIPCIIGAVGAIGDIDKKNEEVCSYVHVDDVKESYKIVDYLCKAGHKRIAILAASEGDKSIGALRVEGYKRALRDNGVPVCKELIRYVDPGEGIYTMERGYNGAKELIRENIECTAIYAISDYVAVGACRALKEEGKRIPEDYSVVGFDGMDIASYYIPSITTICQPVEEMGETVAEILFDMIEKNAPVQHRIFEGELQIRESSKCIK